MSEIYEQQGWAMPEPASLRGLGVIDRLCSLSLLSKVSLSFIAIHLLATILFTVSGYRLKTAADDKVINTRLTSTVQALPMVIGDDYLRELLSDGPFDEQRYRSMLLLLDEYAQKAGVDSIYVLVRRQGHTRFVMDSASVTKIEAGLYGKHLAVYESGPPELDRVFQSRHNAFAEYRDEFGSFRSLFSPLAGPQGVDLVLGADVTLKEIEAERLACLLLFLGIGLATFLLGLLVGLPLARAFIAPLRNLSQAARQIASGDYRLNLPTGRDELGTLSYAIGRMSDVIASRELRISQLAFEDPLTGLPNRTRFVMDVDQLLEEGYRRGPELSVAIFDIRDVKRINSLYGYADGNLLLQGVAQRLAAVLGEGEILARLPSDGFALLLRCDEEACLARLVRTLDVPFSLGGHHRVRVDARLGLARFPSHGRQVQDLLCHAEAALDSARNLARTHVFYDPEQERRRQQMMALLDDFDGAIAAGELRVFLQPKAALGSGRVDAAEALVRWQHPCLGLLAPGAFLPIIEHNGKICALSLWLLRECMQLARAYANSRAVRISVNLSVQDLESPAFPKKVEALLQQTGARAEHICLEITESSAMHNPDQALASLSQLRRLGFALSIDDFGTGHSSLAYLSRLPVDELKIDRSFIAQLHRPEQQEIVRAIVQLGLIMNLRLVAEGVEHPDACDVLERFGCHEVQGYLIAKPMPVADFFAWLAACGGHWRPGHGLTHDLA
ncbi:putative bifunctional diguanylate cyclase/phosphodiesterase [Pseudomonas citri]|uniref:putative bifunctional diguanylate cyclase/phosphodiesterase n=1 Tax=Pseudomonas citri TaxID=2978349 RepID=UPI0021B56121|nr:EAL domain-containing protein [Pseudomonas citri]